MGACYWYIWCYDDDSDDDKKNFKTKISKLSQIHLMVLVCFWIEFKLFSIWDTSRLNLFSFEYFQ